MNNLADKFPALISGEIEAYLSDPGRLFNAASAVGTPFHVVFPNAIQDNISAFKNVITEFCIKGKIYYASKANKSEAALEVAAGNRICIDVASLYEHRAALAHGIPGVNIRLSGPDKDPKALLLAIQHGSSVTIDSPGELTRIISLCRRVNPADPPRILLRCSTEISRFSRFGFSQAERQEAFQEIRNASLPLEGFTFHFDGYSLEERSRFAFAMLDEITYVNGLGLSPRILSVGGGFGVEYLDRSDWENFEKRRIDPNMFFRGKVFSSYYPYFSEYPKAKGLRKVLSTVSGSSSRILAQELIARSIELHLEPGRSLLDQSGITIFEVLGVKVASNGESLVQVNGNINHLSEQWFNSDFVPDPIVISRNPQSQQFRAAVAGNTCMENDMLTWRKVCFEVVPQCGDLLVYLNTAGYMMDSNESNFHQLPIPEKIAAYRDSAGKWRSTSDHRFSHIHLWD